MIYNQLPFEIVLLFVEEMTAVGIYRTIQHIYCHEGIVCLCRFV